MILFSLLVVLGLAVSFFGPWWSIGLVSFILCYQLGKTAGSAFGLSALAAIFVWGGASWVKHAQAEAPITDKMAGLFQSSIPALQGLPSLGVVLLFVVLLGGLLGGLSGLAGFQVKQLFK